MCRQERKCVYWSDLRAVPLIPRNILRTPKNTLESDTYCIWYCSESINTAVTPRFVAPGLPLDAARLHCKMLFTLVVQRHLFPPFQVSSQDASSTQVVSSASKVWAGVNAWYGSLLKALWCKSNRRLVTLVLWSGWVHFGSVASSLIWVYGYLFMSCCMNAPLLSAFVILKSLTSPQQSRHVHQISDCDMF